MKGQQVIGLASLIVFACVGANAQSNQSNSVPSSTNRTQSGRPSENPNPGGRFSPRSRPSVNNALRLTQNQGKLVYTMNGESLIISGDYNEVVLHGKCGKLMLTGNGNIVHVESVVGISTSGHRNEVIWRTGNPAVSNTGTGNNIVSRD